MTFLTNIFTPLLVGFPLRLADPRSHPYYKPISYKPLPAQGSRALTIVSAQNMTAPFHAPTEQLCFELKHICIEAMPGLSLNISTGGTIRVVP